MNQIPVQTALKLVKTEIFQIGSIDHVSSKLGAFNNGTDHANGTTESQKMETNLVMFLGRWQISSTKTTRSYWKKYGLVNKRLLKFLYSMNGYFFSGGNKKRYINSVSLIDRSARIGFPLSFGILILLYWLIYVTYQDDFPMIKQQGRVPWTRHQFISTS